MPPGFSPRLLFAPSLKDTQVQLSPGSPTTLPNHGVEGLPGSKSDPLIECHGVGILPRDRERERLETMSAQRPRALGQKPGPKAATTVLLANTKLGDMANIVAYPRTKQESRDLFAGHLYFGMERSAGQPDFFCPSPEIAESPVATGVGDTGLEPVTSALSRRRSPS